MSPAAQATLLTYQLTTSPDPPRVSVAGSVARLKLTVVGNLPLGEAVVEKVKVHFDVGEPGSVDASYLTSDASGMVAQGSPADAWTVTSSQGGTFVFSRPVGVDPSVSEQGYTFEIGNIAVSPVVGTAVVTVWEFGRGPDEAASSPRSTTFSIPKFPHDSASEEVNFEVDRPVVQRGERVKLSWSGGASADFKLSINGAPAMDVTNESPYQTGPLDEDTLFVLTVASAVDGKALVRTYSQVVLARSPQVTSFLAYPDHIDYQQEVTLTWTTTDADRVELHPSKQGEILQLGPASDPDKPVKFTPDLRNTYLLVPVKGSVSGPSRELICTYKPVEIRSFKVDPPSTIVPTNPGWAGQTSFSDGMPTYVDPPQPVAISYDVVNAHSVTLLGVKTKATSAHLSGSATDHPLADKTYDLIVKGLDGDEQQRSASVRLRRFNVTFVPAGEVVTVRLSLEAGLESQVVVKNAHLMFSLIPKVRSGGMFFWQTPFAEQISLTQESAHWQGTITFSDLPAGYSKLPNAALMFDYAVSGPQDFSVLLDMAFWRGSFDFTLGDKP